MMKDSVFVYPFGGQGKMSSNPYLGNMRKALALHYNVLAPTYRWKLPRMLVFLLNSFKSRIYILNWIENSAFDRGGFLGGLMSLTGLYILKLRKAKMIWIFHNINSHEGETSWTKRFRRFLFKNCTFIVAHSSEAALYASKLAKCPVYFKNHPLTKVDYGKWDGVVEGCDFFYWSSVLPYKGLFELLSNPLCKSAGRKILAVGKCNDTILREKLESLSNNNIIYENRAADFKEIAAQCRKAKYVIFPYIGDSISSSGVLMYTLLMGGTPVGPNRGAFADLAAKGCCITYDSIDEIFSLPIDNDNCIRLNPELVNKFIEENSWEAFGEWMYKTIG